MKEYLNRDLDLITRIKAAQRCPEAKKVIEEEMKKIEERIWEEELELENLRDILSAPILVRDTEKEEEIEEEEGW